MEGISKILVSEDEIKEICARLGRQISEDYRDKKLFLVSVLKGAVVKTVDDVTFFGKNPDSHPIYLF